MEQKGETKERLENGVVALRKPPAQTHSVYFSFQKQIKMIASFKKASSERSKETKQ